MTAAPDSPPVLEAASLADVQTHIDAAAREGVALEVRGGGSKRGWGRPMQAARVLCTSALRGIVDYQPAELILVARPGTPLAEVERTLAEANQALAFEPPHWSDQATLGGVIACNLSGPRRFKAGAARDHLLGFQAVTGTGEAIRGGGKVVKNVTGYDLSKLMCGSFGTLGVLTELVLKVLPRAETECTVVLPGLTTADGVQRLIAGSQSQHEVSGLAHLPPGLALPDALADAGRAGALTLLRVEGPEPSVRHRAATLAKGTDAVLLEAEASRAVWIALRELEPLPLGESERLWRCSVPPAAGAALGEQVAALGGVRRFHDWGGALLWAAVPARHKPPVVHALAREAGGHAQIVLAGAKAPREEPVFAPLSPGQRRLALNLKAAFDPQAVLNPGRMYADI